MWEQESVKSIEKYCDNCGHWSLVPVDRIDCMYCSERSTKLCNSVNCSWCKSHTFLALSKRITGFKISSTEDCLYKQYAQKIHTMCMYGM